jgi:hypothetical protein
MKKYLLLVFLILIITNSLFAQAPVRIALLKYGGGGDWYADPTALPNLIAFCNEQLGTNIQRNHEIVEVGSAEIFNYPFVHMTGHGNVHFSMQEAENLRNYLISGGFLHIDDNFGMDPFVRPQMKKVFPELDFIELPSNHEIYNQKFRFPAGLPKVHEHDGKPPQGFGLFWEGRLVCYYTYETDLSDGWEDAEVHNNSLEMRQKALRMGANIIQYVFTK